MKVLTNDSFTKQIKQKLGISKAPVNNGALPYNPSFAKFAGSGMLEKVFTSGPENIAYYRFYDEQRIPAKRAFAAKDVYQELEFNTTREHLLAHFEAIDEQINKGNLAKVAVLNQIIKERFEYITHIDLIYKLGSVYFIDQSENPEDYDVIYNQQKINRWKQDNDVAAFFLKTPLIEFLPFSDLSKIDLTAFTDLQRKEELKHLQAVLRSLSNETRNSDLGTRLTSQMEILQNLIS